MANLTITVPDAVVPRIQAAFTSYPEFADSGLTPIQFVQKKLRDHIRDVVVMHESSSAAEAAGEKVVIDLG